MRLPVLASLALVLALAPAAGDAQQRGQRGQPPDTTRQDTSRVRSEERGEVSLATVNRGLSEEQVRRLQQSLREMGCEPGESDGRLGPRTRQALACARRERGVESQNLNDVLRALNLPFTATDSLGVSGAVSAIAESRTPTYGDPTFVRDSGVMMVNLDTMPANAVGPEGVFVSSGRIARIGGGVWVRETSQTLRGGAAVRTPPDTAVYRPLNPRTDPLPRPTARDTSPVTPAPVPPVTPSRTDPTPAANLEAARETAAAAAARRDSLARARLDSIAEVARRDSIAAVARRDSLASAMRDSLARAMRDSLARASRADSLRMQRQLDSLRALRPDTSRGVVADSTLRRMRDELLLMPPPPGARLTPADSARADSLRRARGDTTRTPPDTTQRRPPPGQ